jgi:chromosome segregation ATPase
MKCLEKERSRRYETASSLARDVERHLKHDPVEARPPSSFYRFRKLVQRNRLAFAATAAVSASLVLGLIATTWQATRATRAERIANRERERAGREAKRAELNAQAEAVQRQLAERAATEAGNQRLEAIAAAQKAAAAEKKAQAEATQKEQERLRAENALARIAELDAKNAELETQEHSLDQRAIELSQSITNLNGEIAAMQKKPAASENDKMLMGKELKRLMAEKTELERQFNDLTVLRAQISALKKELYHARRIGAFRRDHFDIDSLEDQILRRPTQGVTPLRIEVPQE